MSFAIEQRAAYAQNIIELKLEMSQLLTDLHTYFVNAQSVGRV